MLYCLVKLIHLEILALIKKLRDIKVKTKGQKLVTKKIKIKTI